MLKIKNLIAEMLTGIVNNPNGIAEICAREEKKILIVNTHRLSSFVFVYSTKSEADSVIQPSAYPEYGYIYDYAKIFQDNGFKLLGIASGSKQEKDEPWTQMLVWSVSPLVSMVLFAAILKSWKSIKFHVQAVADVIHSLVGKYESHDGLVTSEFPFKTYTIKPAMENIDVSGEIFQISSEVTVGELPAHRNIHDAIIAHIDQIRNMQLDIARKVIHRLQRGDVNTSDLSNFKPDNIFEYIKTS